MVVMYYLPDKKIIYGIYNVAYRENQGLSSPVSSEANGISTPQTTPYLAPRLSGEYCNHPQVLNVKAYPPSPVSPKFNTLGNTSPYSIVDSNATLTPGSRNEVYTPVSSLTHNNSITSNSSTIDSDSYNSYNNQTFFSNINCQKSLSQQPQQQLTSITPTSELPQNLYYINVNGNWELQNKGNTYYYAKRKEELKNINSPIPLKKCKVYIPMSEVQNNPLYSNNVNDYYQTQQVIVQNNPSVQHIVVQQPTQNVVEQILVTDTNNVQPQQQPIQQIIVTDSNNVQQQQQQPTQQIIVQQVPTITVSSMNLNTSMALNSPLVNNTSLPVQVQQTQLPQTTQDNTVIVQLQPPSNTPNSTIIQQPLPSMVTSPPSSILFSSPPRIPSPIKQEINTPAVKLGSKNNDETKVITPASSPMVNESEEKPQSVIINLSNYKPISSHIDNYKNNKPAVLKFIPTTKHKILKKKMEGSSRITKNSSHNKCDICQKEFLKFYQLKSHLKTHTSEKPYKCEYCTRAFCRKHDLRRHIRIHTGDTPYICSNCFKGFARSDACTRHVRQNLCKSNIINYNPETNRVEVVI